jgi:small-conductance mechanosensitive channel
MNEFLDRTYFENSVAVYVTALGIFIFGIILIKIFKKIILIRLKRWAESTETTVDDFLIGSIEKSVIPLLYFGAFYLALNTLTLPDKAANIIKVIAVILATFFLIRVITSTLRYSFNTYLSRQEKGEEKQKQVKGITTIVTFLIWTVGFLFLLDNLGFEIGAVIAGLGIGGIAIALAAQTILGDLFSYFVIFFDRPFEIGDFIIVGDKIGAVEYIGIKTTRIRSLSGEQLVFSNTDLTNSRLHNYKKMERRRVVFKLGVIYQTPFEKLETISKLVKEIIDDQENATFDRGHFASYGDFSLNFEFVYYVHSADYNQYMDIQQSINLRIYREFESREIEFAYPTQTIFLNKENENNEQQKNLSN